jgi:hypothetical protein
MGAIYYFSSRPRPLDFLPESASGWGVPLDGIAHATEYAGLVLLLHRALSKSPEERRITAVPDGSSSELRRACVPQNRTRIGAALIALAYAILDEIHHEVVPSRSFELRDIFYDVVGMAAALGLIWAKSSLQCRSPR